MHKHMTAPVARGARVVARGAGPRGAGHPGPRAVLLALLLLAGVGHAASFPFNGSFELVNCGQPMGWTVAGSWFVRPTAATEGRNGITVFGDYGRHGDKLATVGYLLVAHEKLTLSFMYSSPTGNVSCGLEFCDSLGNPLATGAWEELPAREACGCYEREITLPETVEVPAPPPAPAPVPAPAATAAPPATTDQPPAAEAPAPTTVQVPYAGVRLVFRIETDGAQIKFDNVKLTRACQPAALPLPPKIKAETRPNLLPNGGFALGGGCDPRGWTAVSDANHAAEQATALPQSNFLNLQAAHGKGAAWLSDPVLLDGALPYCLQTNVDATELHQCRFRVLVALVDPQDDRAVWQVLEQDVTAEQTGTVALPLPRVWAKSAAVRARVGFEIQPCEDGQVQVRNAALYPEPLSLSVRACAVAGGFRRASDVSLFIAAVNNTYAALKPKAILQVINADGKPVVSETRAIVIGPRSAAYFPYKPKLTADGAYRLRVRILNGTVELGSTEYEFRVGAPPQ